MVEDKSFDHLAQSLVDKSLTKQDLLNKVKQDFTLVPLLLKGVCSSKASVRYGCAKVLMDFSEEYPEQIYPYMDSIIGLLDSKFRILKWNAFAIIANLTKVDIDNKFDAIFEKYYSFLDDDYMVTVANVVGNSSIIAEAKPYLISRITDELLKLQDLSIGPHLTEECKRVIAQSAIKTFDSFFDKVEQKDKVLSFVRLHVKSSRKRLRDISQTFIKKWDRSI
ncbi:MAG: hypothetical protein P8X97_07120 [Candidatus Bathyarchaeota archaeon]